MLVEESDRTLELRSIGRAETFILVTILYVLGYVSSPLFPVRVCIEAPD
jgi:hypothetical protein